MSEARSSGPFSEIDRIVCGAGYVPEEIAARARALQAAASKHSDEAPLSSTLVDTLLARRGERVALFTGFVVPETFPGGENDGPLGAVALARALHRAGFGVAILTDPPVLDHTTWLAAEIGADVRVDPIPEDPSAELFDAIDVAIAIEKPGENAAGSLHVWDVL